MDCKVNTRATRNYMRRIAQTMAVYLILVLITTVLVRHGHVTGWLVYALAVVPVLPVLRLIYVVALYLQEETDEFQRLLAVRSILWAAAALLAVLAFTDFLRSYTPTGTLPPFTLFTVFWIVFGLAQGIQSAMNKAGGDDEPA